jgi:RNA-splicing ligase RtcB
MIRRAWFVFHCWRSKCLFLSFSCCVQDKSLSVERMSDQQPSNIAVFGEHEPSTLAQLNDVASRAERAALMADGHPGYVMPIGGVAAYSGRVSVVGVGFDIACGNAAVRTDLTLHGAPGLVDRLPQILRAGAVSPEMMHTWVRDKGVILRGGGLDESPHAYRRLPSVLDAQRGTIEVLHTLRPLIVVMAGADLFDRYTD